ncbi:hypothetical protein F383_36092 [Gossypium arboreum]|nr:hypothetical protein F383_36092 [Gossypium arboreum]
MRRWLVIVKYQLKLFAVCIYIYGVMM